MFQQYNIQFHIVYVAMHWPGPTISYVALLALLKLYVVLNIATLALYPHHYQLL